MKTRIVGVADLTDEDWHAWRGLSDRAIEPNGWLDPVFVRPATAWPAMTDDLMVVIAEDAHAMRGLLAFTVRRLRRLPLTTLTTEGRFMTWHADRHHPLVDAECVDEALGALVEGVATAKLGDILEITLFPAEGPLAEALDRLEVRGVIGVSVMDTVASVNALRPPDSGAGSATGDRGAFEALVREAPGLKSDVRRKIWSKARLLERDRGVALELEDWSQRADLADRFIALQSKGWKGDRAQGGAGFGTDPQYERWFRDVVAGAQREGAMVAVALTAGGELVAINTALRSGNVCSGFVDAFDEDFRSYGPGSLARVAAWRWALMLPGTGSFDPGLNRPRPENARLYPGASEYHHVVIGAGGRGRRALARGWRRAMRAKERLSPADA